jgi:hypothetical protein
MMKKLIIAITVALLIATGVGVYWQRRAFAPVDGKSSIEVQRERAHAFVQKRFGTRGEIVDSRRSAPDSYKNLFVFRIPGQKELEGILVDSNSSEVKLVKAK